MQVSTISLTVKFLLRFFLDGLKPPPKMTVSEWSDKNRILTNKSSAEPGKWRTSRTPYLKEIMDELSPRSYAKRVVFLKGSQIGGTETGINWVMSIIDLTPAPILHAQPTVELGRRWSKQRFTPSIEACPRLKEKVVDNKSREHGNTILQKDFPGGTLIVTGANSAAGLRSMPICYLFADEVDAWPPDADGEGDPLALAERRITNWTRRKAYITSTPTMKGMSRIEKEFENSDQRWFHVPCQFCWAYQTITWDKLKFDSKDHDTAAETVRMICEKCGMEIYEHHKTEMLAAGQWRPTNPKGKYPGFHLSALYSPLGWYSWRQAVEEHLATLGDPLKRKVWTNTVLAELWDEDTVTIDHHWLMKRREKYVAEVPAGVLVLTLGVDTQDDRLEATVFGFGLDYETWIIEHFIFPGDPDQPQVWKDLDALLLREFQHEKGFKMKIAATCVDAMGHKTDAVYDYCRARFSRRVFAVQGVGGPGRALIVKYNIIKNKKVYLFRVSSDSGKEAIYSRLKINKPGPGYTHFPKSLQENYFKQLTSEKRVLKRTQGIPKLQWVLPAGRHNEALDIHVYGLAALSILNPNLALLAKQNIVYSGGGQAKPPARPRILSKGV